MTPRTTRSSSPPYLLATDLLRRRRPCNYPPEDDARVLRNALNSFRRQLLKLQGHRQADAMLVGMEPDNCRLRLLPAQRAT